MRDQNVKLNDFQVTCLMAQLFHIFALAIRADILTSVQDFFVFKQPIKKIRFNLKILCPQRPTFLVPGPCLLREAKRVMGMRMIGAGLYAFFKQYNSHIINGDGNQQAVYIAQKPETIFIWCTSQRYMGRLCNFHFKIKETVHSGAKAFP